MNDKVMKFASVRYAVERNIEVRAIARWCAEHGSTGRAGDALPATMSRRARAWIYNNRRGFVEMVRDALHQFERAECQGHIAFDDVCEHGVALDDDCDACNEQAQIDVESSFYQNM